MADYRVISDSEVDPDAPVTSELAYAFRDNPIAIAEGASGAQRIRPSALNTIGGEVSLNGAFNELASGNPFRCMEITHGLTSTSSTGGGIKTTTLQVSYSTNNGVSYSGWIDVAAASAPGGGATVTNNNTTIVNFATGNTFPAQISFSAPGLITNCRFRIVESGVGTSTGRAIAFGTG